MQSYDISKMPQAPAKQFQVEIKAVFNSWWEESDMDAENLAKAELNTLDDWFLLDFPD